MSLFDGIICGLKILGVMMSVWWHYLWVEDIGSDDVTVWWHYLWVEDIGSDDVTVWCHYLWVEDIGSDDVTVFWWHYPWVEDVGSNDVTARWHHISMGWTCCFEGAGGTGYICLEKILVGFYQDLISILYMLKLFTKHTYIC